MQLSLYPLNRHALPIKIVREIDFFFPVLYVTYFI